MEIFNLEPVLERLDREKPWVRQLESTLELVAERWSLERIVPFENLSFNFVAQALRLGGSSVVLKVGNPNALESEMDALIHYGGNGCVGLLESNRQWGAFLLEHIRPGTMLSSVQDEDEAVSIACAVMNKIHKPPPEQHSFPTLERHVSALLKYPRNQNTADPIPRDLLERARTQVFELLATQAAPVVLHGDLHHFNILSNARSGWTAIDPKGLVGERAFEVGPFFHNPFPDIFKHPDLERVLLRRLDVFTETLLMDRERLRQWAFVQAVLSACWGLEGGALGWLEGPLKVARVLSRLR